MNKWKRTTLGALISIKGGFAYKGEYIGKGSAILLGMGCVSNKEKFLYSGGRPYTGECPDSYLVAPGDLVLATRQQSDNLPILGLPALVPQDYANRRVIVGANLYRVVNTSDVDNQFLYWLLKTPFYQSHISACAKGTTVRMITKDAVESFEFYCPPRDERKAIVDVISSLDNKIDLLRQQNHTLEQMAETLYRQWFVEEAKEYWKEGTLGDLLTFYNGKVRPKGPGLIPVYGGNGILDYANVSNYSGKSIIIGRVGAYCGSLYYENGEIWVSDNALLAKANSPNQTLFVFYLLKTLDLNSMAEGSSHPLLTQTLLRSVEVNIPTVEKMEAFDDAANQWHQKIDANKQQIKILEQTRDTLLPKLMSGEVRVQTKIDTYGVKRVHPADPLSVS